MYLKPILSTLCVIPILLVTSLPSDPLTAHDHFPLALQARGSNTTFSYCPSQPANEFYQRSIFTNFVNTLYGEKNVTKAFETYIAVDLIEHDPFDAQGRAANEAKLSAIIPYASFEVLRHSFDADIGFIHVKVDELPEPIALADIYRMDGTCIVEHWDVTQARPANATNPIAMF
ncbi:hypothetical protein MMC34_007878 [Xylographa carneopallida]|nr:hypothetical protein [Xylographa carneopallida]